MAKFTVKCKFDVMDAIRLGVLTPKWANKLGDTILNGIRRNVARGNSPVKGYGKFVPYKDPEKYPGNRKPASPVNLSLTDQMLGALGYKVKKDGIEFRFSSDLAKKKAETHNEGSQEPKVPMRRFLPTGDGEVFTDDIQKEITKVMEQAFDETIKKSNSR